MKTSILLASLAVVALKSSVLAEEVPAQKAQAIAEPAAVVAPKGFHAFAMGKSPSTGFRYITIQLNDRDVNLLVDSGLAGEMVVSKKTADILGARAQMDAGAQGISGEVQGSISVFKSLKLTETIQVPDTPMNVLELPDHLMLMQEDGKTSAHYGMIGAAFLYGARMAFCPVDNQLLMPTEQTPGAFRKTREAAGDLAIPLTLGEMGQPLVEVELKGRKLTFLIDTGAQGNSVQPEVAKTLELKTVPSNRIVSGVSKEGISGLQEADVDEVVIGGKSKMKLNFLVLDAPPLAQVKTKGSPFGGILGLDVVEQLKGRIDFESATLFVPAEKK